MSDLVKEISDLRVEVAELKGLINRLITPSMMISVKEKSRVMREALASGDPKKIRAARKLLLQKSP